MRLRRRPRYDTLQNETRRRGRAWGRWVYLLLVFGLVIWIFNLFFGELVYFQAEGIVLRDRVVIATQYPAEIADITVQEGDGVEKEEVIVELRSQEVEEKLASLYANFADVLARNTELQVRKNVIEAISPMAARNYNEARQARLASEELRSNGLLTASRRSELLTDEIDSAQLYTQVEAERQAISANLPDLEAAIGASQQALSRLRRTYANGVVEAPVTGIVGYLHVSDGSVVRAGEPLMEIFNGPPYVLAYVPSGALYELTAGDTIKISIGFNSFRGHVEHIYPVASQLPSEFQNTFQPVARAQVVRIEFEPGQATPTLFAKVALSAPGWPPAWLRRLFATTYSRSVGSLTDHVENISGSLLRMFGVVSKGDRP